MTTSQDSIVAFLFMAAPAAALAVLGCGAPAQAVSSTPPVASAAAPAAVVPAASSTPPAAASAAPANSANPPTGSPAAPAESHQNRATLRFEVGEEPFPTPLVDVTVAGQPTTMIVDTGATDHVIATWVATELSLPLAKTAVAGTDHTGRAIPVARLETVRITLSGWGSIETPGVLVTPLPAPLKKLGIGGILSPQRLVTDGRGVVLDLRSGAMSSAPPEKALQRIETDGGASELTTIRACGGPSDGTKLLVPVTIEGIAAEVQVDSGATQSALWADSGAGQKLAGRGGGPSRSYAAGGKYTAPAIQDARVKLGGFDGAATVELLQRKSKSKCTGDGYVGMDVLRSCVLVLSHARSLVRCKAKP